MNEWQALQQIRFKLRNATWPNAGSKIFGPNVIVTASPHEDALPALALPFCLVRPGSADSDPDYITEPGLINLRLVIRIAASVPGDPAGENVLLGANRVNESASAGHGLLEIQEELYRLLRLQNVQDGLDMKLRASGAVDAVVVEGMGYVAFRDYGFDAQVTFDRFYPPVLSLKSITSAGQVHLTWKKPPARFDYFRIVVMRKSGSVAPVSITDGTVRMGADASSFDDTPGAGTWSYSVFSSYDDRSLVPASDLVQGPAVSRTGIAVS